jgi:hypothetical protein
MTQASAKISSVGFGGLVASGTKLAMMHLVNGMAVRRDHAHTRSLSQAVSRLRAYSQSIRDAPETKITRAVSKKYNVTQGNHWLPERRMRLKIFLRVLTIQRLKVRRDRHFCSKRFSLTPCKPRLRLAATQNCVPRATQAPEASRQ